MQIRCYRCGWSFAIKQEEAAFALEALEETGGSHYDSNCPRCRHSNRVSLEQLRKAVPRAANQSESAKTPEAETVGAEEELAPDEEPQEAEAGSTEPERSG
ncbi:MAG: hypothetical protein ACE5JF_05415 [Anaerolineales bacterium]